MKKKIKHLMSLTLALAMCVTCTNAMAKESNVCTQDNLIVLDPVIVYAEGKTQAEIDQELLEKINRQIGSLQSTTRTRDYYRMVWGTPKTATVGGYAGNQPTGGNRFSTGGGFFFLDEGGPEASVSLTFSDPYGLISLGVTLGTSSNGTGKFVMVPNTTNYFKLYVEKQTQVTPIAVYSVPSPNASITEGTLSYITHSVVVVSVNQWAVRV